MNELFTYSDKNRPVQISTTISENERKMIAENGYKYNDLVLVGLLVKQAGFDIGFDELEQFKKNGWTLNDLIRKGIHAMENNTGILDRIKALEKEVENLKRRKI